MANLAIKPTFAIAEIAANFASALQPLTAYSTKPDFLNSIISDAANVNAAATAANSAKSQSPTAKSLLKR